MRAISRRGIIRYLAGATAGGTLIGCGVMPAWAQWTPEATPIATVGVSTRSEEVGFTLSGEVKTLGQFDYPVHGTPPFPAVLLIQGSGPTDRHETISDPDGTMRRRFDLVAITAPRAQVQARRGSPW